jgi:hypothetical protein
VKDRLVRLRWINLHCGGTVVLLCHDSLSPAILRDGA